MNIALGTFLLFLLVIPGIVFRNSFIFGPLSKKRAKSTAFDDFIWGIIPGIVFQLIGAVIINSIRPFGYFIDLNILGSILFGSGEASSKAFGTLQDKLPVILVYNAILITIAALSGFFCRKVIRFFYLDYHFRSFRFNNEWYYILRGEFIFFKERFEKNSIPVEYRNVDDFFTRMYEIIKAWLIINFRLLKTGFSKSEYSIDTCFVSLITKEDNDNRVIYEGIIHSFFLTKDGFVDTICLTAVEKRAVHDADYTNSIQLHNHLHVIKGSEILDIRVNPIQIDTKEL